MNEKSKKIDFYLKIIILFFTSLFLCLLTYIFCYFIAEKFFFDKFFYQKSIKYGYRMSDKKITLDDFGNRSKDINTLIQENSNILGISDGDYFKIAIFGDSLTWGQGVTDVQRFPFLLDKKLNQIRPTKVYSFGLTGDNIFDNYVKYKKTINLYDQIDLYIFALYNNDLIFNNDNRYNTNQFLTELKVGCSGTAIFDPIFSTTSDADFNTPKKLSLEENSINFCVYKKILTLLPKEKSIYIDLGNLIENCDVQKTFSQIISSDLNAIKPIYNTLCDDNKTCYVSKKDRHPSTLIHKSYSDILFNEITTNSKWNFPKN